MGAGFGFGCFSASGEWSFRSGDWLVLSVLATRMDSGGRRLPLAWLLKYCRFFAVAVAVAVAVAAGRS